MLGIASILAACCLMASCTSKAMQRNVSMDKAIDEGDYPAMIEDIKKNGKKLYGETNAFLYNMDIGVLFHYTGQYDSSNVYLMKAAEIHDELFTKSVSNEAAALLTNDNVRPYRSKPYELVMLHQFTALNFMAEGKFREALVETRKSQLLMNEWERTQAKDGKYHTDGMSHLLSSLAYEGVGEVDNSLISLFKSVEAYKKGPVKLPMEVEGFAYDRLKAGDREDDVKILGIGSGGGANTWGAKQGESEIVVVGYAGRGPTLTELDWYGAYAPGGAMKMYVKGGVTSSRIIDIPAPPLPSGKNSGGGLSIKISLPELKTFTPNVSYFTARVDAAADVKSVIINDFDAQAEKALSDAWNDIVTRTIIRVVLRTIAANEAKKQADKAGNSWISLAASVAGAAADQMEKADVRMCFLLPKTIQVARIPVTPGTHSVALNVYDGSGNVVGKRVFSNIEVKNGEKKVLLAHQLKGGGSAAEFAPTPVAVPDVTPAPLVVPAPAEAPAPLVEETVADAEAAPPVEEAELPVEEAELPVEETAAAAEVADLTDIGQIVPASQKIARELSGGEATPEPPADLPADDSENINAAAVVQVQAVQDTAPAPAQKTGQDIMEALLAERGRPYIAVYVRSGIEDDEVKEALAAELLFDFVNSGQYRAVENGYAFAEEANSVAAKQGAGGLTDEQIAQIGGGAKADLVCVVDAIPAYGALQISARVIDVNSATVVKIVVADGNLTTVEEFSAIAENISVALTGKKAGRQKPPPEEPEPVGARDEGPVQQPVHVSSTPEPREERPAPSAPEPREAQPAPPPKRYSSVSIGTGGFYAGGFGGGIEWPSGARVAMPYSGGGWYAFFDGKYVEIAFGYYSGGGKWVSAAVSNSEKLPDMLRTGINFGALVKYPFGSDKVKGFPLLGVDYEASTSSELKYRYGPARLLESGGFSALWFRFGGGLDIGLGERFYLRSELLLGWRTANTFEKDAVSTEKIYGSTANTVSGSGLSVKFGLGAKL